jgi:hypothetical protein
MTLKPANLAGTGGAVVTPLRPRAPTIPDQIAVIEQQITLLRVTYGVHPDPGEDPVSSKEIAWEISCLEAARDTLVRGGRR